MVHMETVFGLETRSPKGSRKHFFLRAASVFKLEFFFFKCDPETTILNASKWGKS